jgi:multisubunit Na+/H+ antiporter MnhE subunit
MIGATLVLTAVWLALTADISLGNAAFGALLAVVVLRLSRGLRGESTTLRVRPFRLGALLAFLLWEVFLANLRVAAAVLGPRRWLRPAVVAVPLDVRRDEAIVLLANMISLTPGTLSIDISPDRRILYVHTMFTRSPESLRRDIKRRFEPRVRGVFS